MNDKRDIILSIVVPSKTFDKSLIACVDSVVVAADRCAWLKERVGRKIEINLVLKENDISPAKEYYLHKEQINFFSQGKILKGESLARNVGIKNSRGRLIGFVDQDCVVGEDWVEQASLSFQVMKSDRKIACILGRHWPYQKYSFWLKLYERYRKDHAVEHFRKENGRIFTDRLDGRNFFVLKDIAEKFSFREDIPAEQDREFGVRLIKNGYKILYNDAMVIYHEPLTLVQIVKRQYNYGIGSGGWRKTPKWFWRFYFSHLKRFLKGDIGLIQMFFTMFCNFLYQMGRVNYKIKIRKNDAEKEHRSRD